MSAIRSSTSVGSAPLSLLRQRLSNLSLTATASPIIKASHLAVASQVASTSTKCLHTSAVSLNSTATATTTTKPNTKVTENEPWKPTSQRVGLIAIKQGMTTFFLPNGDRIAATVLQVQSNQISAHIGFEKKTDETEDSNNNYTALQVAAVDSKTKEHVTKQVLGHLRKAGIGRGKKVIREFPVTKDAIIPLGTQLSAVHFVPGQSIDVRAITRGHGFQGVMKRHGFKGLGASHGVSLKHRSGGSTGANQDPGRVWPGTKMAGRMGGNKHGTIHNLLIVRIDSENELIFVKGNVPGPKGGHVTLQDARRPNWKAQKIYKRGRLPTGEALTGKEQASIYLPTGVDQLPFPAGTLKLAKALPPVIEIGIVSKSSAPSATLTTPS